MRLPGDDGGHHRRAEAIVVPELETDPDELAAGLRAAYRRGKAHALVVVAEGARHNARAIERHFAEHRGRIGFELRVTTLGHVQRGGTPSFADRLLATRLGAAATAHLARGRYGVMVGVLQGRVAGTPLPEVVEGKKAPDLELMDLARVLAK